LKKVSSTVRKYNTEGTKTISASLNFVGREPASPNVKKYLLSSPDYIYEVPIENS
jgi:hypothetical protein